jgi:N-acetylmuramoyl-L-alanine amidase
MRFWLALWLMAPLGFAHHAGGASHPGYGNLKFKGQTYVRLSDWASSNDLEHHWLKRDDVFELFNSGYRLQFTVDSMDALINGVHVRLLFPFAAKEGTAFISQIDEKFTLEPLLHPPKNRLKGSIRSICLDPGHGGKDPGFQLGARQEKKFTLLLAQELRDQLQKAGFKVFLTRAKDTYIELPDRPDLANRRHADLFISLHFNAFSQKASRGVEVYCLTPAGAPSTNARGEGGSAGRFAGNHFDEKNFFLAFQVQKSLIRFLSVEDRGVHRARYAVLRDAEMPAILIEGGFMSNPTEGSKIFDAAYRRQMARAITEAVSNYKRIVEQPSE